MWRSGEYFYTNSFLKELGYDNFITTRKAGDMKIPKLRNIVIGEQTHSTNFREVNYIPNLIKNNDGFITTKQGLWLGVFTADCLPVYVVSNNSGFSSRPKVGALLHAGRLGVLNDIVGKCIDYFMGELDFKLRDIFVVVGPHISLFYYETDLQGLLASSLYKRGLLRDNLKLTNLCTFKQEDFFSYRADNQTTSRMLSGLKIN
ncbi:MAG: polyphenol oxidase family protein [bacterium]|nr:polyphenol oxidase family protein [bacterium]